MNGESEIVPVVQLLRPIAQARADVCGKGLRQTEVAAHKPDGVYLAGFELWRLFTRKCLVQRIEY